MRIVVFQHVPAEHPGVFRDFLAARGVAWDVVELDAGEPIPDLARYDALWVMGGPMDVWEEDEFPWLVAEKAAIREAVVERRMPFLGVCLGHQLLADALGGEVGTAKTPEVGIMDVTRSTAGRVSPFLAAMPATMTCLQWHGAEVQRTPPGATTLMSSPACAVQAFSVGERALGVQFHLEVTADTVPDWVAIPAYHESLVASIGEQGLAEFQRAAADTLPLLTAHARRLFDNWMRVAGG
ncbi:MAG: type 1 glutamine amidotransferase [Gammaproteobacteria bacterium]|nr:type 1 glutamine amidotransferase [Gammaproteobacteria bacterium]